MISKLTEEEADSLIAGKETGYFCEFGAIINGYKQVIIEGRTGKYLAPVSEFYSDLEVPFLVRPSAKLLLAIGGLPETEQELLAKELNVSTACAIDVHYLRTRNRWTEDLEAELIRLHQEGKPPNISEFGVNIETQTNLWWNASKTAREPIA